MILGRWLKSLSRISKQRSESASGSWRGFAILAICWIPALAFPGTIATAAAGGAAGAPDFVVVYVGTPIVALSAIVLLLSPGLIAARLVGADRDVWRWLLAGFGFSLILVTLPPALLQEVVGRPVEGRGFGALIAGISVVLEAIRLLRSERRRESVAGLGREWPYLTAPPLIFYLMLAPKFLWESFNGDGAHVFEAARLTTHQLLPFFDRAAGGISSHPGETTMLFAWPVSWFIRLLGPIEASARLPWLLALILVYAGILAILVSGGARKPDDSERVAVWLGLAVYGVVMAFSATYNPYHADIADPAVKDTLLLACLFAFVSAFLDRRLAAMVGFLVLTWMSLPSGLMLGGLWLISAVVLMRPRPWRRLIIAAAVLLGCMLVSKMLPGIFEAIGLPPPGREHANSALLRRFQWVTVTDFRRLAFVAVPCGLLPFLALFAWRRQDATARALSLVTAAYFAAFYVQTRISLHHFVPAMVIPLAVFWRMRLQSPARFGWTAAAAGLAVAAIVVSLPADLSPHLEGRWIGASVADLRGGYETMDPAAFRSSTLLRELFPGVAAPEVPEESYGGSPLVWQYYARRGDAAIDLEAVAYVLAPADEPGPPGFHLHAERDNVLLWIRSHDRLEADRALRPGTRRIGSLYRLSKNRLFRGVQRDGESKVYSLRRIIERLYAIVTGEPD